MRIPCFMDLVNLPTARLEDLEAASSPTEMHTSLESSLLKHPSTGIWPTRTEKAELTALGNGEWSEYATYKIPKLQLL